MGRLPGHPITFMSAQAGSMIKGSIACSNRNAEYNNKNICVMTTGSRR